MWSQNTGTLTTAERNPSVLLTDFKSRSRNTPAPEGWQHMRYRAAMSLTYSVRLGSLAGARHLSTSRADEPRAWNGAESARREGGPWRVSDYVQTDASAPAKTCSLSNRSMVSRRYP